ncbi:hypothetical protein BD413DRAFT_493410 [Trametes elegans]|nr:hypothetical protein BD413DRAFT_493410 [Trametes elegans]
MSTPLPGSAIQPEDERHLTFKVRLIGSVVLPSQKPWVRLLTDVNDNFKSGRVVQIYKAQEIAYSPTQRFRKDTYFTAHSSETKGAVHHNQLLMHPRGAPGPDQYGSEAGQVYYLKVDIRVLCKGNWLDIPVSTGVTINTFTSISAEKWHYEPCRTGLTVNSFEQLQAPHTQKILRKQLNAVDPVVVSADKLTAQQRETINKEESRLELEASPGERRGQEKGASKDQLPSSATTVQEPPLHTSAESAADVTAPGSSSREASAMDAPASPPQPTPSSRRRFSWHSLVHPKGVQDRKPAPLPPLEEAAKEVTARQEYAKRQITGNRSEKRAHESALVVRELIVGPFALPSPAPPKSAKVSVTSGASLHKVQKVKAQLLEPKAARRVIAQLRQLPTSDVPVVVGKTQTGEPVKTLPKGPIHAVCLPYTDAEAQQQRFSKLDKLEATVPAPSASSPHASPKAKERSLDLSTAASQIASVTATSVEKLKEVFADLDIVSLITAPEFGLGQPADKPGLFSGAVPSADAIVHGVEEITPQLMALGFATGKSIMPSHAGVYPPTDRMSVITYWWGLEVVMPEPSVQYLSNAPSVAHTVINFLTALAVANGGVREILPFVRYISQYIDGEWHMIQQADQGQGVVCAATWIMPAALVPRAWDFPQPPVSTPDHDQGADAIAPPADGASSEPGKNAAVPPASSAAPSSSTAATAPSPTLLTPPLPEPNHAPVFVLPPGDPAAQTQGVRGNPEEGVPGVTIIPATPPTSEFLNKAVGEANGGAVREVPPVGAA